MATTYLSRSISAGNLKKWTFSGWFKKSSNGSELRLTSSSDNSSYDDNIRFNSNDTITIIFRNAGVLTTNRKFSDNSAYYHIVVKVDTDQSTVNDRIILYVNGVDERVNGYSTDDLPGQGLTGYINSNAFYIGVTNPSANSNHFNGIMSHVHFTDGYAYDASAFGETDATTGEWRINASPSITMGTNGFTILKDGNTITDQSSNSNNFSLGGGTLTNTEDCPSNVFAILNAITPSSNNNRAGGTRHFNNSGGYDMRHSTLAVTKGKYYAEFYIADMTGGFTIVGIQDTSQFDDYNFMTNSSRGYGYRSDGTKGNNNSSSSFGNSFTSGDYIGVAVDLDNNKIYFSKNGVWQNSGDPTSGATGTGSAFDITDNYDYCIATSSNDAGTDQITDVNFGNGYFNVTAVSSAGTNASGNGIFEYDVPTGFTALSTKGLNK